MFKSESSESACHDSPIDAMTTITMKMYATKEASRWSTAIITSDKTERKVHEY